MADALMQLCLVHLKKLAVVRKGVEGSYFMSSGLVIGI
jgi:hypothetical protein